MIIPPSERSRGRHRCWVQYPLMTSWSHSGWIKSFLRMSRFLAACWHGSFIIYHSYLHSIIPLVCESIGGMSYQNLCFFVFSFLTKSRSSWSSKMKESFFRPQPFDFLRVWRQFFPFLLATILLLSFYFLYWLHARSHRMMIIDVEGTNMMYPLLVGRTSTCLLVALWILIPPLLK